MFSADLEYEFLIFEYFTDFQFFSMSFDLSNDMIHRFDSFCRGIPIIPFAVIKVINNYQEKICASVLQIFDTHRKPRDVVANTVVEKVLTQNFTADRRRLGVVSC